jgi:hypothetical protein
MSSGRLLWQSHSFGRDITFVDFSLQNEYLQVWPLVPRGDDKTETTSLNIFLNIQFPCRHVDFRRHHTCRFFSSKWIPTSVTSRSSRWRQNGNNLAKHFSKHPISISSCRLLWQSHSFGRDITLVGLVNPTSVTSRSSRWRQNGNNLAKHFSKHPISMSSCRLLWQSHSFGRDITFVDFSLQNEYLQVWPLVPRGDDKTETTSL